MAVFMVMDMVLILLLRRMASTPVSTLGGTKPRSLTLTLAD